MRKSFFSIPSYLAIFIITIFIFWVFSPQIKIMSVMLYIMPWKNFSEKEVPTKLQYEKSYSWIAHPTHLDLSKFLPDQNSISNTKKDVVVFFVHPTTFINRKSWNQPKNDYEANEILRKRILINQAVIFSACCDVYVPAYRQATLYSFVAGKQNQEKAFSIAYQDVLASFEYFNQNFRNGRPYILAGHSQGSMHALKLLKEIRNNSHLYSDMVAAYLVGFNITKSDIYPTKVCESEDSINCVVAWNSVEKNGFVTFKSEEDLICVNPLSWNESEKAISSNFNLGGVGFNHWSKNKIKRNWKNIVLEPKVAGAKCKDGNLLITNLYSSGFPVRLFSLHAYDYGLFFSNILKNTKVRSSKFLKTRPQ